MKTHYLIALTLLVSSVATANAEDLYLADGSAFPGQLWLSEGGTAERSLVRRAARPDPAFPNAVTKLAQTAIGSDGKIFYASGLDGCVMHLLDGRNEIMAFEFDGQIRDLATTGEEHTVYFSVVPTPQDGAPVADGKIYRRDLWEGRPSEVATVQPYSIAGDWWGTFAIKDGAVYIVTWGDVSRIYRLNSRGEELVYETRARITGLTAGAGDEFFFVTGDRHVYRTRDFATVETVLSTDRLLTDVALRTSADAPRP